MYRDTKALGDGEFDLLIIGGGAFGAAAARDAALRGLRTALIERADFGGGASAECFKIVHGGIRYLQHADVRRLRSSCRERSALLRIAPHLVNPLPIAVPTYGYGRNGRIFLGTGMCVYDLLTFDRNAGLRDRTRQIQRTRFLNRADMLDLFPDIESRSLTGGVVFEDGQMYSPPRLVLAFITSAVADGAIACNYVEATDFIFDGNAVCGVRARDNLDGSKMDVRARLVLNAAGPGAEFLLERDARFGIWQRGQFSRDACFVVRRRPRSRYGLAVQGQTRDRDAVLSREARHIFIVPWHEFTLVGVWHKIFQDHPDSARVEITELEAWIREINACYPTLGIEPEEIAYANCGLVPFGMQTSSAQALSFGKESRLIDHSTRHGVRGLVTLIGIRYTTARGDAARALDLLLKQMPNAPVPADTEHRALAGGDVEDFERLKAEAERVRPSAISAETLNSLLHNHGTEYGQILQRAETDPYDGAIVPDSTTLVGEVTHSILHEMAVTMEDVVLRRTDLGAARHPGQRALECVARRMQGVLGWSDERTHDELTATEKALARHRAVEPNVRS
jgi:glycerol-3-phosphate dehydrogenase